MDKNEIVICEVCNKKGLGKSMVVLEMKLVLRKQAKYIFADIEKAFGFNDKDNYYTNATKIKYQEIKSKYREN